MTELPRFDDDIWARVRQHDWKYRERVLPVRFVELHCTRSGIAGRTPEDEYGSTINWSLSEHNKNPRGADTWASMESFIVGGGKVCRVLAEHVYPHYSLGHADPQGWSIEIGQNLDGTGFDPRDLEHAAQICAVASQDHNIPVKVLPYLSSDNHEGPGYVRHDRSANGGYYGKSDPGRDFDDLAFEALVRTFLEEEDMFTTYTDTEGFWLVHTTKGGTPYSRRKFPNQNAQAHLIEQYGTPLAVGEGPPAYSKGQFKTIPIIN